MFARILFYKLMIICLLIFFYFWNRTCHPKSYMKSFVAYDIVGGTDNECFVIYYIITGYALFTNKGLHLSILLSNSSTNTTLYNSIKTHSVFSSMLSVEPFLFRWYFSINLSFLSNQKFESFVIVWSQITKWWHKLLISLHSQKIKWND